VTPIADLHADLLVIGGGPGGYTAAFRAADLGRSVVLADRSERLGGVCLNVGCIPSKALLHAAKIIKDAADFESHGVRFGSPTIELNALRSWKDSIVSRLTGGLDELARRRKVTVLRGTAEFAGANTVTVANAEGRRTVSFDQAIIAAGSEPVRLPFVPHDDPRVVDSTGALTLTTIPERFLIIGGGVIGLEMATIYEALGSRVTVVELMDQIIPGADRDLVAPLHNRMALRGIRCHLQTKLTRLDPQEQFLVAHLEGPDGTRKEEFDMVLIATGRRPNGTMLRVESAGLTLASDGSIPVDAQMRTNAPHIFAIGDIVGPPMLAHKAAHEAKVAAEAACGHKVAMQARVIPAVAYTDPEVAWVGLTELEAKRLGLSVEKAVFPWAASGRSLALGRDEGSTKLIFDPTTHRLLGAGIVGPGAGELIAEAALAIEVGADAEDISLTIHPHPTLSETISLAAEIFAGTITDLPPTKPKPKPALEIA
jgi:dihydrolipoamide dehydrogenase